jgi:hypothetical protein
MKIINKRICYTFSKLHKLLFLLPTKMCVHMHIHNVCTYAYTYEMQKMISKSQINFRTINCKNKYYYNFVVPHGMRTSYCGFRKYSSFNHGLSCVCCTCRDINSILSGRLRRCDTCRECEYVVVVPSVHTCT